MKARMENPASIMPEATKALQSLWASLEDSPVPAKTLELVHLRASQINGCATCIGIAYHKAMRAGASWERFFAVSAWRDSPHFSDAERAALALTEAVTRMSDQPDPVPDSLWSEVSKHYDERALAALILAISTVNVFNRVNVTTRQVAGSWAA